MKDDPRWPELPLENWKDTYATLHLWLQIVGKIRLKLSPFVNHWWHTALYVSTRGLRTSPIPYQERTFEIEFDLINHLLILRTSEGERRTLPLEPRSVADFYGDLMGLLGSVGISVQIDRDPKEIVNPIPFDQDWVHAAYDKDYAHRCFQLLVQADRLMNRFRSGFTGKCSPVHFYWGSFDMAVSRFSGRPAPARPGADRITRVAYSHEVSSCGFWPGSAALPEPAFYAYCAPEPPGFSAARIHPAQAFYSPATKGFVLRYEEIRRSTDPDRLVLGFFQSTYDAGADLGHWDRAALERGSAGLRAAA